MSPMPMPFVVVAAIRNTVEKKTEQARRMGISDVELKMSAITSSEKNPSVIKFGIRPSRKSKNEIVARYKRQVGLVSICGHCSFISKKYRKKKNALVKCFLNNFLFFFVDEIVICNSCSLPKIRTNRMNLLLCDCYSFRNCFNKILPLVASFSGVAGADNNFVFSVFKFLRKGK